MHMNLLSIFLNAGSNSAVLSWSLGIRICTRSQVIAVLLASGPHFEEQGRSSLLTWRVNFFFFSQTKSVCGGARVIPSEVSINIKLTDMRITTF